MFNLDGNISHCATYPGLLPKGLLFFGGGSGASGAGQSGKVDYPEYMKTWHKRMLAHVSNLVKARGVAPITHMYDPKVWFGIPTPGYSPYKLIANFNALDTKTLFKELLNDTSATKYLLGESAVNAIKIKADELRALLVDPAGAEQSCSDMIDAHAVKLLQKVNTDVMPKVETGMRDANAVIGTSFVIARELVMEDFQHEVADFSAKSRMRMWELRHELYKSIETAWLQGAVHAAEIGMKRCAMEMERLKIAVTLTAEVANVATLAQSKYGVVQTEKEIRSKTWKLDIYDHMNKTLASIAGASPVRQEESKAAAVFSNVLGFGAMGAGVGAYLGAGSTVGGLAGGAQAGGALGMSGGPVGAILGGMIGAGAGVLSGLFK